MIWLILGTMLLAAAIVVGWPLVQHEKRLSLQSISAIVVVLALSAGMYATIGTPQEKSAGSELASIEEMVAGLDQRLRDNPVPLLKSGYLRSEGLRNGTFNCSPLADRLRSNFFISLQSASLRRGH